MVCSRHKGVGIFGRKMRATHRITGPRASPPWGVGAGHALIRARVGRDARVMRAFSHTISHTQGAIPSNARLAKRYDIPSMHWQGAPRGADRVPQGCWNGRSKRGMFGPLSANRCFCLKVSPRVPLKGAAMGHGRPAWSGMPEGCRMVPPKGTEWLHSRAYLAFRGRFLEFSFSMISTC